MAIRNFVSNGSWVIKCLDKSHYFRYLSIWKPVLQIYLCPYFYIPHLANILYIYLYTYSMYQLFLLFIVLYDFCVDRKFSRFNFFQFWFSTAHILIKNTWYTLLFYLVYLIFVRFKNVWNYFASYGIGYVSTYLNHKVKFQPIILGLLKVPFGAYSYVSINSHRKIKFSYKYIFFWKNQPILFLFYSYRLKKKYCLKRNSD